MDDMPQTPFRPSRWPWVLLCLALPALAAPNRRGASIGDAKDDDLAIPIRLPAKGPSDLGLLKALMWAFEPLPPEPRVQAVENLGLLGDARALNALAHLVQDPNPSVALAALRAIGLIRHPRAEEILTNVIRHPTLGESVKVQAAALLVFQNTDSAVRFMKIISRTSGWSPRVQATLGVSLQDVPPGRGGMP